MESFFKFNKYNVNTHTLATLLVVPTLYAAWIDKDMNPPPELEMSFSNSVHTASSLRVKDTKRSLRAAELSVSSVTLVGASTSTSTNT